MTEQHYKEIRTGERLCAAAGKEKIESDKLTLGEGDKYCKKNIAKRSATYESIP